MRGIASPPVVALQIKAVRRDPDAWTGADLARLAARIDAFGGRCCLLAYARSPQETQDNLAWIEACGARALDVVYMTDDTARAALLYVSGIASRAAAGAARRMAVVLTDPADARVHEIATGCDGCVARAVPQSACPDLLCQIVVGAIVEAARGQAGDDEARVTPARRRPVVIGYAMRESRELDLARRGLMHMDVRGGACFAPVAASLDAQAQRLPFDVVLHKATDWSTFDSERNVASLQLPAYFLSDPPPPLGDDIARVVPLITRSGIHDALSELARAGLLGDRLKVPRAWPLAAAEAESVIFTALPRPLIAKAEVACGTSFAHRMLVLPAAGGSGSADREDRGNGGRGGRGVGVMQANERAAYRSHLGGLDVLCQDWIHSDGHEIKVYVIGERVHVSRRPLPPALQTAGDAGGNAVAFDGAALPSSAGGVKGGVKGGLGGGLGEPTAEQRAALCVAASALRDRLGLSLFGFDCVVDRMDGDRMAIVDVNYFPSFKQVPRAAHHLRETLVDRAHTLSNARQ